MLENYKGYTIQIPKTSARYGKIFISRSNIVIKIIKFLQGNPDLETNAKIDAGLYIDDLIEQQKNVDSKMNFSQYKK